LRTPTPGNPKFDIEHRAYVINAVLSAVAFLDASINEVFDDVTDAHPGYVVPLTTDCRRLMLGLWDKRTERRPILEKYRLALLCSNNPDFDQGGQPYQDAKLLIDLRNRLTHARAKTRATGDMDKFDRALKARFASSRLTQSSAHPYTAMLFRSTGMACAIRLDRRPFHSSRAEPPSAFKRPSGAGLRSTLMIFCAAFELVMEFLASLRFGREQRRLMSHSLAIPAGLPERDRWRCAFRRTVG
jgi:hypothetical protein